MTANIQNTTHGLSKSRIELVDSQAKFPDWSNRQDQNSDLKVGLILWLDEHGYPPEKRDDVYQDIFNQAENLKQNSGKNK